MAVTVYDIAKAAGVGRTTVLRALWGKEDINPDTKARIKAIAAQMKYRPNYIARSLVSGKSRFVGVMVTRSLFSSASGTIDLLESSLRSAGYTMLLEGTSGYPSGEREALERMMQNRVAGVIVVPSSNTTDPDAYIELVDSGVRTVVIDRFVEGLKTPQIIGDDYRASRLSAEHLISLGHKRIAYLAIPETSYVGRERARGFRDSMKDAGLEVPDSSIIETQFNDVDGARVMAELLKKNPPTAVIARHDVVAVGAIRAIYEAGYTVPEYISLVGNGDIWCSDALRVPLTSIRHPIEQMTEMAVGKLLDMLADKPVIKETVKFDVSLVVRSSTAPPRKD